jgi:hypothetical protein
MGKRKTQQTKSDAAELQKTLNPAKTATTYETELTYYGFPLDNSTPTHCVRLDSSPDHDVDKSDNKEAEENIETDNNSLRSAWQQAGWGDSKAQGIIKQIGDFKFKSFI